MDPAPRKFKAGLPVTIALLCFLPVFFATIFYYSGYRFKALGQTNYGTLVEPSRSLTDFKLEHPNGFPFLAKEFGGAWALVWVMPVSCSASCQSKIFEVQQIQIALGKYQDRLLKYVLVSKDSSLPLPTKYNIDPQAVLVEAQPSSFWVPEQLYLIDSEGRIVLVYPTAFEGKKVLGDIRHLIKLSTLSR